jgi:hypothetical protein
VKILQKSESVPRKSKHRNAEKKTLICVQLIAGLPDFSDKYYRILPTCGHKIFQHFPIQGTPKFAQVWIFGLKITHLAALVNCRREAGKGQSVLSHINAICASADETLIRADVSEVGVASFKKITFTIATILKRLSAQGDFFRKMKNYNVSNLPFQL